MVWIHGRAFKNVGSSLKIYDGTLFAEDGVIFVSLNCRMGRFGFFGFPELTKQDKDESLLGNYDYIDQISTLRWVHDNIAGFGGDPNRVTIFRDSAGGGSVLTFLSPNPDDFIVALSCSRVAGVRPSWAADPSVPMGWATRPRKPYASISPAATVFGGRGPTHWTA